MKKINIILLSIFLIVGVTSCKEFLYVKPTNILSLSSYNDVRSLMGAHLKQLKDRTRNLTNINIVYEPDNILTLQFYADDLEKSKYMSNHLGRNNQGEFLKSLEWKNPDVSEKSWSFYYQNIGFYNMIIDELNKYPSESKAKNNEVLGEAKVLRAYSFFKLVQLFVPYHEPKLGLPLNTNSDAVGSYNAARRTQKENYDFIINELREVLAMDTEPSKSYNLFFDKNFITGLLAQVFHYKGDSGAKETGDYAQAIAYAKETMEKAHLSYAAYSRVPSAEDSFGYTKESGYAILSFLYYDSDRIPNVCAVPEYGIFQYATQSLYDLFSDNDLRKKRYFNADKAIIKTKSDFPYQYAKIDLITAADLQLIIAESYARENKQAEALAALTAFGATRYEGGFQLPAGKSVLDAVLDERRKEFCFEENCRWLDLHRVQKGYSYSLKIKNEERTYQIEDNDFRFCLPIPLKAELANNKIEQNPSWGTF